MADMYAVSGETLTGIADAIRSKTGSDEQMTVAAMASAIEGIPSGLPIKCEYGELHYDADTTVVGAAFTHSLGVIPRVVLVWSEDILDYQDNNTTVWGINILNQITDQRNYTGMLSGNVRFETSNYPNFYTATNWKIPSSSSSNTLRGGATYKYLLIA